MFELNDYVMHNLYGVLQITGFDEMEFDGISEKYYVLKSVFAKNKSTIIKIPVNKIGFLSPIISRDESHELIQKIKTVDTPWIPESKKRIQYYETIITSNDLEQLCGQLKNCYEKRDLLKLTTKDKEFVEQAERIVFGELAISLDIPYDSVVDYISGKIAK